MRKVSGSLRTGHGGAVIKTILRLVVLLVLIVPASEAACETKGKRLVVFDVGARTSGAAATLASSLCLSVFLLVPMDCTTPKESPRPSRSRPP